jgi:hypothetical protein
MKVREKREILKERKEDDRKKRVSEIYIETGNERKIQIENRYQAKVIVRNEVRWSMK